MKGLKIINIYNVCFVIFIPIYFWEIQTADFYAKKALEISKLHLPVLIDILGFWPENQKLNLNKI